MPFSRCVPVPLGCSPDNQTESTFAQHLTFSIRYRAMRLGWSTRAASLCVMGFLGRLVSHRVGWSRPFHRSFVARFRPCFTGGADEDPVPRDLCLERHVEAANGFQRASPSSLRTQMVICLLYWSIGRYNISVFSWDDCWRAKTATP